MKGGREHRVPLSSHALRVLETVAPLRKYDWVFEGRAGKALTDKAMIRVLRRIDRPDLTVHGFRSTFRDWAAEATNHPREVAEAALAHALRDKTEAAYQRGDLMEKRRRLMEEWSKFCAGPAMPAEVVPIRA